jgi:RNA polymerase sigma-70 factor, ECF subfamily
MHNDLPTLISQASRGNEQAFGRIYEQLYTPLYRYILVRVKDRFLAEDLTQTVFMRVYGAAQAGKDISLAYLYTAARNAITDHWRKAKYDALDDEALAQIPDERPHPHRQYEIEEQSRLLIGALQRLSDEDQTIVMMRFMEGQKTAEVAKAIGKSEAATRQAQSRALKKMAEFIKTKDQI